MHPIRSVVLLTFVGLLAFVPSFPAHGQSIPSVLSGLGLEIGAGLNQLFWTAYPPDGETITAHREQFFVTPTARLHYAMPIIGRTHTMIFAGYSEFGGRSPEQDAGWQSGTYRDAFHFRAVEMGAFVLYDVGRLGLGLGAKANHHLQVRQHLRRASAESDKESESLDASPFFDPWSGHAGARLEWSVFQNVTVSAESWLGITRLERSGLDDLIDTRQNHFRLLIGYRL